jgi:hypothetical protein
VCTAPLLTTVSVSVSCPSLCVSVVSILRDPHPSTYLGPPAVSSPESIEGEMWSKFFKDSGSVAEVDSSEPLRIVMSNPSEVMRYSDMHEC